MAFAELDNFVKGEAGFKECKKRLIQSLITNKSSSHFEILPFKYGIVDDCLLSNEGQEKYNKDLNQYISQQSTTKIKASELSISLANKKYESVLSGNYAFTNELDKLGQGDETRRR